VPLVAMRAAWIGGLRDEAPETNGVSNLLAALVTRGAATRTGDQIAHEIESLAGAIGGFSGRNSFGIRAEVMARHFDHGLGVLADCVLYPTFADDEIQKERRQVLEEIRTQEDNISSVTFRLFAQALYARHPYRLDLLGTPESLAQLDRARIAGYYQERFTPEAMSIAIVGDVDPAATIAQVARLFPPSGRGPYRAPAPILDEPPAAPLRVRRHLNKQQAHLVIGFPGTTIADPDRVPLEVLSSILSGQGGRLFVELREKRGLAYRVSAFTLEGIDPGYVAVYVATSPENLRVAEEAIRVELQRVIDRPVGASELARAKRYLAGSHDISLQRRSALAAALAFNECYGLGWDQYLNYGPSILRVTAADVRRVATKFLDMSRSVTAVVTPEEASASVPRVEELPIAARAQHVATARPNGRK
jgi:zinc protease